MTLDELDRLAAREIMGWRLIPNTLSAQWGYYEHDQTKYIAEGDWQPTRNIAQAWECLEKFPAFQLFRRYPQVVMRHECILYSGGLNSIDPETVFIVEAETAQLAIVRACLKAMGVEV